MNFWNSNIMNYVQFLVDDMCSVKHYETFLCVVFNVYALLL